jgi:hypothetical protein
VRQPNGRREEPLVIQGGSSPKTRATCPLGEFGGWTGWKPQGLLLLNMISFHNLLPTTERSSAMDLSSTESVDGNSAGAESRTLFSSALL